MSNSKGIRPRTPPTDLERETAREAAKALRLALADKTTMGTESVVHIDYSRPRRAEWITTWSNLPGFSRVNGAYHHKSLPGWVYSRREVILEMIPDLEALAERGERPTEVTNHG